MLNVRQTSDWCEREKERERKREKERKRERERERGAGQDYTHITHAADFFYYTNLLKFAGRARHGAEGPKGTGQRGVLKRRGTYHLWSLLTSHY